MMCCNTIIYTGTVITPTCTYLLKKSVQLKME